MSLHPNQVLLAPVVSEKSYSLITDRKYTFKVHEDAHKTQIRQAVEELFEVKVAAREHRQGAVEAEAPRLLAGTPAGLEEGDRRAARGLRDRDLRGGGSLMALKKYKPTSPGRRFMATSSFEEVTKTEPEKTLLEPLTKKGGRNNRGRITTRHQGGGHKRRFRKIDFKRRKDGVPAKVAAIEYDPNRSARIALLHYADGDKAYILAPARLRVGSTVESGPEADIKPGNALPLSNIPTGTLVHCVELKPGQGARMARSAGSQIQLVAKDGPHAVLRLPSGELRRVLLDLPRDGGPGREHGSLEPVRRQGGPEPLAGQAPDRPRVGHEPGRPPARRRRGQVEGRTASRHSVGRPDAREAHPP